MNKTNISTTVEELLSTFKNFEQQFLEAPQSLYEQWLVEANNSTSKELSSIKNPDFFEIAKKFKTSEEITSLLKLLNMANQYLTEDILQRAHFLEKCQDPEKTKNLVVWFTDFDGEKYVINLEKRKRYYDFLEFVRNLTQEDIQKRPQQTSCALIWAFLDLLSFWYPQLNEQLNKIMMRQTNSKKET